jgi:hypothetical protein
MKKIQVYFIHQCQIQYSIMNIVLLKKVMNFVSKIHSVSFDKSLKYWDVEVLV